MSKIHKIAHRFCPTCRAQLEQLSPADLDRLTEELERNREAIENPVPQKPGELTRHVVSGWTYIRQLVNCGKHSCKTCAGASYKHGPYWYAYRRVGGKMTSKYIGTHLQPIETVDGNDDEESEETHAVDH